MWLATMHRKRHQCRIKPPEWMDATNLGNVLKDEKANATAWQQLPYHYIEIAKILFTVAEEDPTLSLERPSGACFRVRG